MPLLLRPVASVPGFEAGRWRDATSVYGYAGPLASSLGLPQEHWQQFLVDLAECLRERGIVSVFVRLHPFLPQHRWLRGTGRVRLLGPTVWINLRRPTEQQWRSIRARYRTAINRLRRNGFQFEIDDQHGFLVSFVECYQATMNRVHARSEYYFDLGYFQRFLSEHSLGGRLVVCHRDGKLACGGIFTQKNGIVQYHLGGTAPDFLHDAPMKLLFDEVRIRAVQERCRILHLGGGVGSQIDGLFYFKAGFSKERASFRTWEWILDEPAYSRLCRARGIEGENPGSGSFFPAYRRPVVD